MLNKDMVKVIKSTEFSHLDSAATFGPVELVRTQESQEVNKTAWSERGDRGDRGERSYLLEPRYFSKEQNKKRNPLLNLKVQASRRYMN